jgi:LysM domain
MPSDELHPLRSVGIAPVRWTRSALTTAFLAITAVAPAASIAAEPDTSQEGGGPSGQVMDQDSDSPTFDPGGETDLPYDTGPGSADGSPDAAPLESEPVDDPEGRTAPFADPQTPAPSGPEQTPARPLEQPSPVAPAPMIEPPSSAPDTPPSLAIPPQHLGTEPGSAARARRETWTVVTPADQPQGDRVEIAPDTDPGLTAGAEADSRAGTALAARQNVASVKRPAGGGRIHVVRPGESLWIIAESLLADHASAIDIAAEVARLWELNRDRIPSGDPDLIEVGQQLRLR